MRPCPLFDRVTTGQRHAFFPRQALLGLAMGGLIFLACLLTAGRAEANPRYASIVIEAETGYVLSERHADRRLHPASLTKVMTLYMTFDAIRMGKLTRNTRIPVSRHAAAQIPSKLDLHAGSTIRVEDAIYALVTRSANDAAVVLAEAIGGSESEFATQMTRKARQLGLKNTTFRNASGLHHRQQVSTVRDMARLGQAILRDFPREYSYFSTRSFRYAGKVYNNHNRLMNTYAGMDGIKTGYIHASGFNLIASAKRGNTRLIGVVFGGRTAQSRNAHMQQLLDMGFDRINDVRVAQAVASRRSGQLAAAKPLSATSQAALRAAANAQPQATSGKASPHFDALGLVTEQGDRANDRPMPGTASDLARATLPAQAARGDWAIQVGAFSSHAAGMAALKTVHDRLPAALTAHAEYVIVPLMTNRGMIYRARLTGLSHQDATRACQALRETCLVLTAQ